MKITDIKTRDGVPHPSVQAAVEHFKCPGPCDPDCPLWPSVRIQGDRFGHLCHEEIVRRYPAKVLDAMGCGYSVDIGDDSPGEAVQMDGTANARKPARDYTVCFLLTSNMSGVLLQTKDKTDFKGMLNGVGGKLEPGETPEQCAWREIREETGLGPDDINGLTWLGTVHQPFNCDNHAAATDPAAPACVLYYYAGVFDPDASPYRVPEGGEKLDIYAVDSVLDQTVRSERLADNVQYFVRQARLAMDGDRKEKEE